jgi:DNA polymerase V
MPYYKGVGITGFDVPTNNTSTLISGALSALRHAYQSGHAFQSAGIHALDLIKEGSTTQKKLFTDQPKHQLFRAKSSPQSIKLIKAIDAVNQRYGKDTVFWASSGINPRHTVKQEQRSPRYTTRWGELVIVL